MREKADEYRGRFDVACRMANVQLDLDGDGVVDTTRELGVIQLVRV